MYYASTTTIRGVWVWNSRDGVTPFCIFDGGEEFRHVDWAWDRFEPDYQPTPGLRYFRDRSQTEAEEAALRQLEKFAAGDFPIERDSEEWTESLASLTRAFLQAPKLDRWDVAQQTSVHQQAA
jgi:hypothetical protein